MPRKLMSLAGAMALLAGASVLAAQQPGAAAAPRIARIELRPATLTLSVNDTATVTAAAFDSAGTRLDVPLAFFSLNRRSVGVDSLGRVKAHQAGNEPVRIVAVNVAVGFATRGEALVTVRWPALDHVTIAGTPARFYAGTTVRHRATVVDASGATRDNVPVSWASDNPAVASVDRFGDVTAHRVGVASIRSSAGGIAGRQQITVVANPARTLILTASADGGRTGDVIHFSAVARDAAGRAIADFPVLFAVKTAVEDTVIAPEAPAEIDQDGRFVAQRAGDYTVVATAGRLVATRTVAIAHRYTSIRLATGKGHGAVSNVHTSDLWVWTGKDGHDYAVTGTWGANGYAYFWDVTDPASPVKTDSIQVDARTVNDVKVDLEREICVITREGASTRKNGFVVLDCHDPHHITVLSRFDDQLWGGVHNVFIWNQHVFAINAGTRFDIVSIEDPRAPRRVGFYELETPGHGIHDVWVQDGIACTSNWQDGALLIDVGNGKWGGSLSRPVKIAQYKYPIGATHSCFQYHSPSAGGKWYAFVGDEQFPYGLGDDEPDEAGGYIHVVDFTDSEHPKEVARYQVPEAGPHNFWVQNDTLYVAYYNAGLRVVDVSGELMGNLYNQGRELVRFEPRDSTGKVANAPMAWGPQPFHGHVFVSDFNSGLWTVKLPERPQPAIP
jgi:hypothetical protein